jgi:hypothetical protein
MTTASHVAVGGVRATPTAKMRLFHVCPSQRHLCHALGSRAILDVLANDLDAIVSVQPSTRCILKRSPPLLEAKWQGSLGKFRKQDSRAT